MALWVRRGAWFLALWCAGIGLLAIVAMALRWTLGL